MIKEMVIQRVFSFVARGGMPASNYFNITVRMCKFVRFLKVFDRRNAIKEKLTVLEII
ncbi:hypothetical protein [Bacillus kwashiorkori]|uniref:hypothetical protein n=1 Tax=Bacillus kwashiorkori TaxID=1522318 RepID=UPI001319FCCE|nr:hypothetical protein [Bacillus kwashiorkori]